VTRIIKVFGLLWLLELLKLSRLALVIKFVIWGIWWLVTLGTAPYGFPEKPSKRMKPNTRKSNSLNHYSPILISLNHPPPSLNHPSPSLTYLSPSFTHLPLSLTYLSPSFTHLPPSLTFTFYPVLLTFHPVWLSLTQSDSVWLARIPPVSLTFHLRRRCCFLRWHPRGTSTVTSPSDRCVKFAHTHTCTWVHSQLCNP
jgi:hypothetical protein